MSAKVTAKAVSQVQNQLPEFIGDEFPLYKKFMEHYYEFMETLCVYYKDYTVGQLSAMKMEDVEGGFLLIDSTDGATANAGDNVLTEETPRTAANAFTVGETVTGQTSGATATAKATGAFTAILKVFLEPTNDLNFEVGASISFSILSPAFAVAPSVLSINKNPPCTSSNFIADNWPTV